MKNKNTAAILAFFLGGIGIHRFYLNQTIHGIVYLLLCWTFVPLFIALIDFIVFLSMSQEKFDLKYNSNKETGNKDYSAKTPTHCASCNTELTFMTTPNLGGGKLSDGGRICRDCFAKMAKIDVGFGMNSKRQYDSFKVKEALSIPTAAKRTTSVNTASEQSKPKQENITLKSILASVSKPQDIKKLEIESEKYDDKFANSDYENTKYEKLSQLYQEAFRQACDIVFYYQFVPNLDLNSPKQVIDFAYKTVEKSEYKLKRKEIGGTEYEWNEITGDDLYDSKLSEVIEEPPFYYNSLVKYRQIVDSDIPFEEKKNSINNLVESDKSFFDEFFERGIKESAGEQWTKVYFQSFGIPLVDRLYDLGYDSPMKFIETDIETFKTINGLGPQKIEQLQVAINKLRKEIENTPTNTRS